MTKLQFVLALNNRLSALPQNEIEERLKFYSEMIEDRMEEGLSEEDAVAAVGSVEEIAAQILGETACTPKEKGRAPKYSKRRIRWWEILLLVLGSPLWLSLLIVFFAVILVLYMVLWVVIITLWSVFGAVVGCSVGFALGGTICCGNGATIPGVVLISAGLVCAGVSILLFFGCKWATKGLLWLTKRILFGGKRRSAKKEVVQ